MGFKVQICWALIFIDVWKPFARIMFTGDFNDFVKIIENSAIETYFSFHWWL